MFFKALIFQLLVNCIFFQKLDGQVRKKTGIASRWQFYVLLFKVKLMKIYISFGFEEL